MQRGEFRCDSGSARCSATAAAPSDELCDGIDNNCNGTIDDFVTVPRTPCDVVHPWCERHGALGCWNGVGVICTVPPRPGTRNFVEVPEVCIGRDDGCNGLVDEIPERQPDGTERPCPRTP